MKKNIFIVILALFIVYNLFFINKAIHIDDYFTIISIVQAIQDNFISPLRFYKNPESIGNYYISSINDLPIFKPILLGYYYSVVMNLFGLKDFIFHLFYLPFSIIAIIAMYRLGNKFSKSKKGILPVLLFMATPAFVVMSHTLKSNIPFLSFFLMSIAFFISGNDRDDTKLLLLSGLFSAIAVFISYAAILFVPLAIVYACLSSKAKNSLYALFPFFTYIICCVYTFMYYDRSLTLYLYNTKIVFNIEDIVGKLLSCLSFLTGASVFIFMLFPYILKKIDKIFIFSIPFCILPFVVDSIRYEYALFEKIVLSILFIISVYIVFYILKVSILCLKKKNHDKDFLFLSFWFFLMLIFVISIDFNSVRYMLFVFTPFCLIIYRLFQNKIRLKVFQISIVVTFIISTVVAVGDYNFANVYRDFIGKANSIFAIKKNVYFLPGDWGYNYYVKTEGYNFLTVEMLDDGYLQKIIKQDGFIIVPWDESVSYSDYREDIIEKIKNRGYSLKLIDEYKYFSRVVIHNKKWHAGFYSHDWGLFPYSFFIDRKIIENFKVYRLL